MTEIDKIRLRAFQIWEAEGRPLGRDLHHWLQAEIELSLEPPRPPKPASGAAKAAKPTAAKKSVAAKSETKAASAKRRTPAAKA